ncbi:MAG TPA: glycosyltransferase [Trueperaceae bacterium]|nr:glycosyltransferase [Trueperaceae bacterium]
MRVVLSVGTHEQRFERMVAVADALAAEGHDVTIQYGYSTPPTVANGFDFAPTQRLAELFAAADVIVTHAGPATVLQALEWGKLPIVFPRLSRFHEHVDDHQPSFARHLQRQGLARVAATEAEVLALAAERTQVPVTVTERITRVAANRARLAASLDAWLAGRRRPALGDGYRGDD